MEAAAVIAIPVIIAGCAGAAAVTFAIDAAGYLIGLYRKRK
jgi:hypothetical protein